MRCVLVLLVCSDFLFGQPILQKTWIGPDNQCLRIRNDALDWIVVDWVYRGNEKQLPYSVKSDTLSIVRLFPDSSDSSGFKRTVDNYRILKLSHDSLVISRIHRQLNDTVWEFPLGEPWVIAFVDSAAINDRKLTFNNLTFSTSGCFGTCPVYTIFLDAHGNVRFRGERYTDPFIGSYIGKVPNVWMEQFIDLLRRSRVEHISHNRLTALDVPVIRLAITLNGNTKEVKGTDFSPFNAHLFNVISHAYKEANLARVDTVSFEK